MKILIVSATALEIQPMLSRCHSLTDSNINRCSLNHLKITLLQTGIGSVAMATETMMLLHTEEFDAIIQVGICGTFDYRMVLGSVVEVVTESLVYGAWENEIEWRDNFDMKLTDGDEFPYQHKMIMGEHDLIETGLPKVKGLTVQQIETNASRLDFLKNKYKAQIETMEGGAIFYVARRMNIPVLQIRAVSNYCGVRNRELWKIDEAVANLNNWVLGYLEKIK